MDRQEKCYFLYVKNLYNFQFIAVPIRISLRYMLMMRCRAIDCSQ